MSEPTGEPSEKSSRAIEAAQEALLDKMLDSALQTAAEQGMLLEYLSPEVKERLLARMIKEQTP
jgi:hypothetical protein